MSTMVLAALVVVAVAGTAALSQWGQARTERRLNDAVGISAEFSVSSSSSSPLGGRVSYFATIHNQGPRRVRIVGVSIVAKRLRIASRRLRTDAFLPAGSYLNVSLSVRLVCARQPGLTGQPDGLRGTVDVRPLSGSLHRVPLIFGRATPLIDVAETLCSIGPHRFGELSGPILGTSEG